MEIVAFENNVDPEIVTFENSVDPEIVTFENSVEPDTAAHHEPLYLALHGLLSCLCILNMIYVK